MNIRLRDYKENLTYVALWLLLFLTPVMSMAIRTSSDEYMTFDWAAIFRVWKIYAIYLIIFLIHNYILAPLLIYRHKKLIYFTTIIAMLAVFVTYQCSQKPPRHGRHGFKHRQEMMERGLRHDGIQPKEHGTGFLDAPPDIFAPALPPDERPRHKGEMKQKGPHEEPPFSMGPADIVNTIMVVLLLGMNLGIKLYFKSDRDAKEMQLLEKKNLEQQLEYLKYQINPHFFMNTLNNIHALVDIDPDKAKSIILELSKLMRYVLYEGAKKTVSLSREMAFLNNYITLMKIRYTDKVKINVDIPDSIPECSVPPMLFIPFVENAFKHGISYQEKSYINVEMRFADERVHFTCTNSKHNESDKEHGGVGLANVKKRLELIYGDNYTLDIHDDGKDYSVKLDCIMFHV